MSESMVFRISSGLKNIIGNELITDDLIAIFELVKNSYDAKAKKVDIIFKDIYSDKNAKIIIRDNGNGMNYKDIKDKWLFVGYSEKKAFEKDLQNIDYRDKANLRKIFAGAKGIGRFSCDRLGKKLMLYSKIKNENEIHGLEIDWGKFEENMEDEFQSVKVYYHNNPKSNEKEVIFSNKQGVILEISELNSIWDAKKIIDLKRKLQQLINPSYVSPELDFSIEIQANDLINFDNDVRKIINRSINRKEIEYKNLVKEITSLLKIKEKDITEFDIVNGSIKNFVFEKLEIKTTQIICSINNNGKKITTELRDKGTFIYKIEEENDKYKNLHDITATLYYLNKSAKTAFTSLMGIRPKNFGSIFLYKNGFKINPYGNEGDDWLGLELRRGQGYARFLSARDLMGRVEVLGYQPNIQEVSSRDGGVYKSQEFEELKVFFKEISLKRLENYVVQAIDWDSPSEARPQKDEGEIKKDSLRLIGSLIDKKSDETTKISFNKHLLDIYANKEIEKTPDILESLQNLQNYDKDNIDAINLDIKTVRNAFTNLIQKQKENEKQIKLREKQAIFIEKTMDIEKADMAGLKHQIGLSTKNINLMIKTMSVKIGRKIKISDEDLIKFLGDVSIQIKTMSAVSILASQATYDLTEKRIEQDLIQFITQYIENVYKKYYQENTKNVEIVIENIGKNTFLKMFAPTDYVILIDNLISNSIKAKASVINISFNKLNENACLLKYKDNGKGIDKSIMDMLFQFGAGTTVEGSGIGLYQIKKILEKDHHSTISINPETEKGAEFIIEVKK